MIKVDYHTHTNHSPDGRSGMEDMIVAAIRNEVSEIAFCDHVDYLSLSPQHPPLPDYQAYRNELEAVRAEYGNKIKILFGVEIGIGAHLSGQIDDLTSNNPFEFIIGSIHDINSIDIYYPDFYQDKDKNTAYKIFFEYTLKAIESICQFDVLGHIDYIERYGRYEDKTLKYTDYREIIDAILKTLINKGKGLEINTSGFRYNLGHTHPQYDILKRYRELGGEIVTIGSDAHNANNICSKFDIAEEMLRRAGFRAFTVYRDRKPVMVDIN